MKLFNAIAAAAVISASCAGIQSLQASQYVDLNSLRVITTNDNDPTTYVKRGSEIKTLHFPDAAYPHKDDPLGYRFTNRLTPRFEYRWIQQWDKI